ncbi:MAG: ABC transporter ATP-binding protein, partial [Clostridiales bacterium]
DEPTANLDYGNQFKVLNCICNLADEGYTIIQSTHNPEQAQMFSHEILALKESKILAWGDSQTVMTSELISNLYNVDVEIASLYEDKYRACVPKFFIKNV